MGRCRWGPIVFDLNLMKNKEPLKAFEQEGDRIKSMPLRYRSSGCESMKEEDTLRGQCLRDFSRKEGIKMQAE